MVFEESQFAKALATAEKRMFDSLHQTLLIDNGVADLLGQMAKINKALGLMEDSSGDEKSSSTVIKQKSISKSQ